MPMPETKRPTKDARRRMAAYAKGVKAGRDESTKPSVSTTSISQSWMPISTAPKDGTKILFASKHYAGVNLGFYEDGHIWTGGFAMQPSAIPREWEDVATHWMAIPPIPGSATCMQDNANG